MLVRMYRAIKCKRKEAVREDDEREGNGPHKIEREMERERDGRRKKNRVPRSIFTMYVVCSW